MAANEIHQAAVASSLDPTIRQIAAAIEIQATGAEDPLLLKLNLARAAMGSYLQYDRAIYPTKTVAELRMEAQLRGEHIWRGDCKSEAVVLGAILEALRIDYTIQARTGFPDGHAWVRAAGYDLNELPELTKNPLPKVQRFGPPRPELVASSLTICNSFPNRVLAAN